MLMRSEGAAVRLPKRGFLIRAAPLYLATLPALAFLFRTGIYGLAVLPLETLLFGTMNLSWAVHSPRNAQYREGTLTIDDTSVAIDGRPITRREDLKQGFFVPTEHGTLLRFDRKGLRPTLYVRVKDEAEGRRILDALGFDATHAVAEIRTASRLLAM